jgi:hypothetical protein
VAVVGYRHLQCPVDRAGLQRQLAAVDRHVAHRLDAVLDQVEQHLLDHDAVDHDARQVLGQVDDELRAGTLGLDVGEGAGFVDQFGGRWAAGWGRLS